MEFKNLQHCDKQMRELAARMRTYKKKRERFGLTDEEAQEQRKMLREFYLLQEEVIDSRLEEVFFPLLYTTESRNLIKVIQKDIPWNGGCVIRNVDVDNIMDAIEKLNGQKRKVIYNAIIRIHEIALAKFQDYCNEATEQNLDWLEQVSTFIVGHEYGTIFDIIGYIDTRYRDFADLLGIELPDLDIEIEDEEDEE